MHFLQKIINIFKRFGLFLLSYLAFTVFLGMLMPYAISYFKQYRMKPNSVLVVKIESSLPEKDGFALLKFRHTLSMQKLRRILKSAADDAHIKGVVFNVFCNEVGGYAQIQELRSLIKRMQKKGKFVYFYTSMFGESANGTSLYYLASCCDKIYLQHGGMLNFLGIVHEEAFFKDALDKVKLKMDVFKQKEYKSFLDKALANDFLPEVQENKGRLYREMFACIKREIAVDRNKTEQQMTQLVEQGCLMDQEAFSKGYVDGVIYTHELQDKLKDKVIVKWFQYPVKPSQKAARKVAVIYCEGMVMKASGGAVGGQYITDKHFSKVVDKVIAQKYDGLIIRLNTRGGSATASETMYGALLKAKRSGMKVVVSMGDCAASAGYMLAAAADKIVAEPLTITGSIGVIHGRPSTRALWESLGVHWRVLGEGENANLFTPSQELTTAQHELLNKSTKHHYDNFVAKVALGRNMSIEAVDAIAGGRVWSGETAKHLGLVDILGGVSEAEDAMKVLLKSDVMFVDLKDSDFSDLLTQMMTESQMSLLQSITMSVRMMMYQCGLISANFQ